MNCFSVLNPKEYITILSKEIENLNHGNAPIQKILSKIYKRENTMKNLHAIIVNSINVSESITEVIINY